MVNDDSVLVALAKKPPLFHQKSKTCSKGGFIEDISATFVYVV
jgi:hypothetical protein